MKTIISLLIIILLGSILYIVSDMNKQSEYGYNSYVEGAIEIYTDYIPPSPKASQLFYRHIESKYNGKCYDKECTVAGKSVALQYVIDNGYENEKIQ